MADNGKRLLRECIVPTTTLLTNGNLAYFHDKKKSFNTRQPGSIRGQTMVCCEQNLGLKSEWKVKCLFILFLKLNNSIHITQVVFISRCVSRVGITSFISCIRPTASQTRPVQFLIIAGWSTIKPSGHTPSARTMHSLIDTSPSLRLKQPPSRLATSLPFQTA